MDTRSRRGGFNAYAGADGYAIFYLNIGANQHVDARANRYGYGNARADGYAYTGTNSNVYTGAYRYANSNTGSHARSYAYLDA